MNPAHTLQYCQLSGYECKDGCKEFQDILNTALYASENTGFELTILEQYFVPGNRYTPDDIDCIEKTVFIHYCPFCGAKLHFGEDIPVTEDDY